MRTLLRVYIIFLLFSSEISEARVFSFSNESFAGYIRTGYGLGLENGAMSKSNGTAGTPADSTIKFPYNLSGEFGFVYSGSHINFRFGIEVLRPQTIDTAGTNGGTELYDLKSEASVVIPKLGLEFNFIKTPWHRVYMYMAGGSASLAARNAYTLTAAGDAAYNPIDDFYEDLRGTATTYEGSFGYEGLLADTTTWSIELGYRSLNFTRITHNRAANTFTGNVVKGDVATNTDGSDRNLNLTGAYASIGFRFWIN